MKSHVGRFPGDNDLKKMNFSHDFIEACERGDLLEVRYFLERGVDTNSVDKFHCSGLYYASYKNNIDVVKLLLKNNVDVELADNNGRTPLFMACVQGHLEIAELLMDSNANINYKVNFPFGGETILINCIKCNQFEVAKKLLEKGADPYACDEKKFTFLNYFFGNEIQKRKFEKYLKCSSFPIKPSK